MAVILQQPFTERTNAKLRYARVHLDELKSREPLGGDDFNRAHAEAFLFHLLGAKDCFWAELAAREGYPPAPMDRVTQLRARLKKQGKVIGAIEATHRLARMPNSWLRLASDLRHIGTHDRGASRAFSVNLGGSASPKVQLRDPRSGTLTGHLVDEFDGWLAKMTGLIARYRSRYP